MPGRSGALRLWLLRAATALLAFAFAMPACTVLLWQDNRSLASTPIAPEELEAFRATDCPTAFFVHLPPTAVAKLREHAPELPTSLAWLRVDARDAGFAEHLTRAMHPEHPRAVDLSLYRDAPGAPLLWSLQAERGHYWFQPDWSGRFEAAVCDVAFLPARPNGCGEPIRALAIDYATCRNDGTPVLVRIALTPLTLASDTVLAAGVVVTVAIAIPIYPFVWLGRKIGGDAAK